MSKIKELSKELEIKNEQLFVLHDVVDEDTLNSIFKILEKDNVFQIVVADCIVSSKKFQDYEEANNYIKRKPWELIVNVTLWFLEKHKEVENMINEKEEN